MVGLWGHVSPGTVVGTMLCVAPAGFGEDQGSGVISPPCLCGHFCARPGIHEGMLMFSCRTTVIWKFCLVLDCSRGWRRRQDLTKSFPGAQVFPGSTSPVPRRVVLARCARELACVRRVVAWGPGPWDAV